MSHMPYSEHRKTFFFFYNAHAQFTNPSIVVYTEELHCTPLILVNGQVTYSQAVFTIGTVANYSCNTGFAILGILSLTCLLNTLPPIAYWSPGNRPVCIRKFLYTAHNVLYSHNYFQYGIAELRCRGG